MNQIPQGHTDPLHGTRYRVLSRLGSGTMGEVFLVEHVALERKFVVKLLHARHTKTDEYIARLKREARTIGQIPHRNIVVATDFDVTPSNRPFIVMEYLEGRTLDDVLRHRGRLSSSEAFAHTRGILSALGAAHAKGVVHRDIKPQNLFLHSKAEAMPLIKVLDFGAARDTQRLVAPSIALATSTGAVIGTFGYLSPEGANGRRVDHRADLYSAGLVLTTMLSGHLPMPDARRAAAADVVAADLDLPGEISFPVAPVILKAIAFEPDRRFQSAEEFLDALPEP